MNARICGSDARVDGVRMRGDGVEDAFLAQAEAGVLVVDDGIDRDRRLRQPVGQDLLARLQGAETFGAHLDEAGGADAVDECSGGFFLGEGGGGQGQREQSAAEDHDFHHRRARLQKVTGVMREPLFRARI